MGTPGTRDLTIPSSSPYTHVITFEDDADPAQPLDVSGVEFLAQVRRYASSPDFVQFTIEPGEATNQIVLSLTAAQARSLPPVGTWDLQADGQPWLRGSVVVDPEVSREEA